MTAACGVRRRIRRATTSPARKAPPATSQRLVSRCSRRVRMSCATALPMKDIQCDVAGAAAGIGGMVSVAVRTSITPFALTVKARS